MAARIESASIPICPGLQMEINTIGLFFLYFLRGLWVHRDSLLGCCLYKLHIAEFGPNSPAAPLNIVLSIIPLRNNAIEFF